MATTHFELKSFEQLAELFERAPLTVAKFMSAAMEESVSLLHYRTTDKTPIGVGNGGHLAQSIQTDVTTLPDSVVGAVTTNKLHGEAVELGTRPHMPPIQPLKEWVEVVLGLKGKEVEQVAFLVAMKIKHRGTKGKFMFRDSLNESEKEIETNFVNAVNKVLENMSNG